MAQAVLDQRSGLRKGGDKKMAQDGDARADELVKRSTERLAARKKKEAEDEAAAAERLRGDYMRRTGRREMNP